MPELGPYGSVRGARGNSRPYRESRRGHGQTDANDPERTSDVMWSPLLRRSRERSIGRQRDPGVA